MARKWSLTWTARSFWAQDFRISWFSRMGSSSVLAQRSRLERMTPHLTFLLSPLAEVRHAMLAQFLDARMMNSNQEVAMAKKAKINKSEVIRELLTQNPQRPVKEIVMTLGEKGIKVQPSLVYFLKSRMKRDKRMQVRKSFTETTGKPGSPVELIIKVRNLATEAGGYDQLKRLIEILTAP